MAPASLLSKSNPSSAPPALINLPSLSRHGPVGHARPPALRSSVSPHLCRAHHRCGLDSDWRKGGILSFPLPSISLQATERTWLRRNVCLALQATDPAPVVGGDGAQSLTKNELQDVSKELFSVKQKTEELLASMASQAPPLNQSVPFNFATTLGITMAVFIMVTIRFLLKPGGRASGSVEELVRRGQLRSDRRSNSRPLKYEDPFNNPMVKMGGKNPVVRMCGKLFRLQPVTLTQEKMQSHQNRRVQAYQWKRPTVFLSEGEPVPEGVDPDTVRWIPSNHPFASASSDIDEGFAEKNIYQTRGVPSRVRAEHEALRKRMMEASQREMDARLPAMHSGADEQVHGAPKITKNSNHEPGSVPNSIAAFDKCDIAGTAMMENPTNGHV